MICRSTRWSKSRFKRKMTLWTSTRSRHTGLKRRSMMTTMTRRQTNTAISPSRARSSRVTSIMARLTKSTKLLSPAANTPSSMLPVQPLVLSNQFHLYKGNKSKCARNKRWSKPTREKRSIRRGVVRMTMISIANQIAIDLRLSILLPSSRSRNTILMIWTSQAMMSIKLNSRGGLKTSLPTTSGDQAIRCSSRLKTRMMSLSTRTRVPMSSHTSNRSHQLSSSLSKRTTMMISLNPKDHSWMVLMILNRTTPKSLRLATNTVLLKTKDSIQKMTPQAWAKMRWILLCRSTSPIHTKLTWKLPSST